MPWREEFNTQDPSITNYKLSCGHVHNIRLRYPIKEARKFKSDQMFQDFLDTVVYSQGILIDE